MDTDKIIQDLNRRFAAPLPEFYQRRIIFWYDEDKEFEDKLDEVVLENAKVIALTGNNAFSVKKLLLVDDLTTNYLVYSPCVYNCPDDNWLLDVELYSEEFRADLISIWMDEMGLISNPAMRKQVKNYRAYFNAKDRRLKVSTQNKVPETPAQLHMAVMAAICGLKDAQPNMILRSVFQAGLDLNNNTVYQDFVKYHADAAFWAMVRQGCGFVEEEPALGRLAIHLLLTAATRTMRQEYLAGLDGFISMPHQAYCYDFISEWLHSDNIPQLYDVARYVEDEARLYQRFEKLTVEDLVGTECFPCINEVILTKLMTEISDHIIDVDTITNTVEKRRTCVWYEPFENFYDGILQVANMQSFFKEHSAGFHTAEAKSIWKEYTESYYQMDTYYRLFHLSFQKSLETSNILLDDLFKHVVDKVEGLYTHWFLGELGNNWSDVCADELATYGKVLEVPQQEDFYRSRIQTSDTKVFVIISDAMRYEVAATMADQLQRETQSKVSISSMQSIFPSTTKFGMAALLPHKELTVEVRNDILTVLADGQSTASTYRDKVLKTEDSASVALKYNDIIAMKRAERSALVKGMDVVYIYHDTIDEASHTSDTAVFAACDKAISELKNLVRIIVNEFGGTNILITADHGFLYTYSPLKEEDKVDKRGLFDVDVTNPDITKKESIKRCVEYGRRYAIMQKGVQPDYLMPVKFLGGNTEFDGFAPRESIRIKMNGGGMNFVHGGISLQEMVVPVIEYHYLRNDSMEYRRNKQKYDTKPVSDILSAIGNEILKIGEAVTQIESNSLEFADVVEMLSKKIDGLSDEFAEIKREIKDDTLDIDGFVKMTEELEKYKENLKQLNERAKSKKQIESAFKKAMRERNDILLEQFNAYKLEIQKINESQNELKITIDFKGDRDNFKSQMKTDFRGSGISEIKYQYLCDTFRDYVELIEDWILCDGMKIKEIISSSEYTKLDKKLQDQYADLLKNQVSNNVEIYYHDKLLRHHSIGQRASALILFILMQSDNDIILIDQPEDDLDNKIIYDEVITAIAKKKQDIQFIFATHNANIPVLGDAERIFVVEYQDTTIDISQGNIDLKSTHKQIVDIMEGGEEAFDKRQLIYTSWK